MRSGRRNREKMEADERRISAVDRGDASEGEIEIGSLVCEDRMR